MNTSTHAASVSKKSTPSRSSILPPSVQEVLRSPGHPLEATAREFMEPRFGHDFGSVRIHNDSGAIKSAQAINAQAYTVGNNVVFGENKYAPTTGCGRELLAHELAHTIQQRDASGASPSHEHEADAAEAQIGVIENKPVHIRARSRIGIARQPLFPEPVATKSQAELIKEILYQKSCTTRAGFENWLAQEQLENFYWEKIAPKNFPGEQPSRALPPDFSGMAFLAENAAAQPTPLIENHSTAGVPGPLPSREQYAQWKLGRPKTDGEWAEQGDLATGSILGSMAMSKGDSHLAAYGNSIVGAMAGNMSAMQTAAANQSQNDSKSSVPAFYDKPSEEIDSAETQPDPFPIKAAAPDYGRSGPLDPTQPDWAFDKTEPGSPPRNDTQYSIPPSGGGGGSGSGRGRAPGRTIPGNPPPPPRRPPPPQPARPDIPGFPKKNGTPMGPDEVMEIYKIDKSRVIMSVHKGANMTDWSLVGKGLPPLAYTMGNKVRVDYQQWKALGLPELHPIPGETPITDDE